MRKAACYIRVSTDDQTVENQRGEVEQLCRARGFDPVWFEEVGSAAKRRPVFERMMAEVRARKIDAVIVWALDRLHRSMRGAISDVLELDRRGIEVISVREGWLDTGGPVRSLLVAIFGWVAEQERARLIERTKAGQARARKEGKTIGRPRVSGIACGIAERAMLERGASLRKACKAAGVSPQSFLRWKARQSVPKQGTQN